MKDTSNGGEAVSIPATAPFYEAPEASKGLPRRYLYVYFPESVGNGKVESLKVYISQILGQADPPPLDLQVPDEGLTVGIFVKAIGFKVLAPESADIFVPRSGDSATIGFRLKAVEAGDGRIIVSAFSGGTRTSVSKLSVTVHPTQEKVQLDPQTPRQRSPVSLRAREEASLILYRPSDAELTYFWRDEDGMLEPITVKRKFVVLEQFIEKTIKEIQSIVRRDCPMKPEDANETLKSCGIDFWNQLVPTQIRERFIAKSEKIRRLTVISTDNQIPWEMLYPLQKQPHFDRGFLAEQVELSRWRFADVPPSAIRIRQAHFVIPNPNELANAHKEIEEITTLFSNWDESITHQAIHEAGELFKVLREAKLNLLHFACHNSVEGEKGILLKGTPVTPKHFAPYSLANAPFVFINACHSDSRDPGFTSVGGWANCLLDAGIGALLGTSWEVRDGTARIFSRELYDALTKQDKCFGEALRLARERAREAAPGDPTWIAYCFYGDTDARLERCTKPKCKERAGVGQ